jgi:putative addiction module killer protein
MYADSNGKSPFEAWLTKLKDVKGRAKIKARIDRLSLGNLGDSRPVGCGVSELKIDFGPRYRVYFSEVGKTIILLLCGGDKSTQKQDIQKAQTYLEDYKGRSKQYG